MHIDEQTIEHLVAICRIVDYASDHMNDQHKFKLSQANLKQWAHHFRYQWPDIQQGLEFVQKSQLNAEYDGHLFYHNFYNHNLHAEVANAYWTSHDVATFILEMAPLMNVA